MAPPRATNPAATALTWVKAPKMIQDFSGLRQSIVFNAVEHGIFLEGVPVGGRRWSVRRRPVDSAGEALTGWGEAIPFERKKEAVQWVERQHPGAT